MRRFPVEIIHAGSIYENQIETFSGVWKQRIDSRNRNLSNVVSPSRKRSFRRSSLVKAFTYKAAPAGVSGYWRLLIETFMGETLCPAHAIDFW
jgi:hypothetical protein